MTQANLKKVDPIHGRVYQEIDVNEDNAIGDGDSAAGFLTILPKRIPPHIPSNAEWMSLGPWGAVRGDTTIVKGNLVVYPVTHRLRVTFVRSELTTWLIIDDLKKSTLGGDARVISAEYEFRGNREGVSELYRKAMNPQTSMVQVLPDPPIRWTSPTSFEWIKHAGTLHIEQKADSLFEVTLNPVSSPCLDSRGGQ